MRKEALWGLLLLVAIAGVTLRFTNREPAARSADEGFYTMYAKTIAEYGPRATASAAREYNADKALWFYPPPIRIGFIYPVAAAMKILGSTTMETASTVSLVFSIVSLFILAMAGVRFFSGGIALAALFLMALSPLELALAQRVWQESLLTCAGAALFYFAAVIVESPGPKRSYFLFAFCGAACILIKEFGALYYAFCFAWIAAVMAGKKQWGRLGLLTAINALAVVLALVALAGVCGGIKPLFETLAHAIGAIESNPYAQIHQTEGWEVIRAMWILNAPAFSLFFIGVASLFSRIRFSRPVAIGALCLIVAFSMALALSPYGKNLRYLAVVFGPFYLLAGLGFWTCFVYARKWFGPYFPAAAATLAAWLLIGHCHAYTQYRTLFIDNSATDLSGRQFQEILSNPSKSARV